MMTNQYVKNDHGNDHYEYHQFDCNTEYEVKYHVKQHPVVINFLPAHLVEVKDPYSHLGGTS